jgi:hypothetical protein
MEGMEEMEQNMKQNVESKEPDLSFQSTSREYEESPKDSTRSKTVHRTPFVSH